ncbi:hypothetical protein ILUMI_23938 [Ignelater luminosus]|uniref:Uncharacterized protein n=1 Tax=Ignelater luminosus TaxID=2038154 RepID=A0A8K0C7Z3_IGNLU|nr:hypothetical protein ILUMI_23938 [Ignelater luminosus]
MLGTSFSGFPKKPVQKKPQITSITVSRRQTITTTPVLVTIPAPAGVPLLVTKPAAPPELTLVVTPPAQGENTQKSALLSQLLGKAAINHYALLKKLLALAVDALLNKDIFGSFLELLPEILPLLEHHQMDGTQMEPGAKEISTPQICPMSRSRRSAHIKNPPKAV